MGDEVAEGDGHQHGVKEAVRERPLDDKEVKKYPEEEHCQEGRDNRDRIGKTQAGHRREGNVRPQHVELALGEVEYLGSRRV